MRTPLYVCQNRADGCCNHTLCFQRDGALVLMRKGWCWPLILLLSSCATSTAPTLQPFADAKDWVLVQDMTFQFADSNQSITVPKGFVTDFASIPQAFWSFGYSPLDRYSKAAIVHDYLYWSQVCTKAQADNILSKAMKDSGVSPLKAATVYEGVRLGGALAWNSNKKARSQQRPRVIPWRYLAFPEHVTWAQYQAQLMADQVVDPEFEQNPEFCKLGDPKPSAPSIKSWY